jgi:uncharacterized LabA/DUF88 family protein
MTTMAKIMLFIDGTWLHLNTRNWADASGQSDFLIDYGKLPRVLADTVDEQIGGTGIDLVRTHLFGSYADNYGSRDNAHVTSERDFFRTLRQEFHYEVEEYPRNYRGTRFGECSSQSDNDFDPKEKCVDVALATSMLYLAAIPHAYDIAIAVLGDQDFKPALQHVRRLGKRVAIASIRASCAAVYSSLHGEAGATDFDIIWLDDLRDKIQLQYEEHVLECRSGIHDVTTMGPREQHTTFHPRKGQLYYCGACRILHGRRQPPPCAAAIQKAETRTIATTALESGEVTGIVKQIDRDGPVWCGYIHADGQMYYFDRKSLCSSSLMKDLSEEAGVGFNVFRKPNSEQAGIAQNVRILSASSVTCI